MNILTTRGGALDDRLEFAWRVAEPSVSSQAIAEDTLTVCTIDTEVLDTGNHGSISANTITLDAGTYEYTVSVPVYLPSAGGATVRLVNTTDGDLIASLVEESASSKNSMVFAGAFKIASQKDFQIDIIYDDNGVSGGIIGKVEYNPVTTGIPQDRTRLSLIRKAYS